MIITTQIRRKTLKEPIIGFTVAKEEEEEYSSEWLSLNGYGEGNLSLAGNEGGNAPKRFEDRVGIALGEACEEFGLNFSEQEARVYDENLSRIQNVAQYKKDNPDANVKIIIPDYVGSQQRVGGRSFVADAKFYKGVIQKAEAEKLLRDMKLTRGSCALLITGKNSTLSSGAKETLAPLIEEGRVVIVQDNRNLKSNLKRAMDSLVITEGKSLVSGYVRKDGTRVSSYVRNDAAKPVIESSKGEVAIPRTCGLDWNGFQSEMKGKGLTKEEVSQGWSTYKETGKAATPSKAAVTTPSNSSGSTSGSSNLSSWNSYQQSVKGQGLSKSEISKGYAATKGGGGSKGTTGGTKGGSKSGSGGGSKGGTSTSGGSKSGSGGGSKGSSGGGGRSGGSSGRSGGSSGGGRSGGSSGGGRSGGSSGGGRSGGSRGGGRK